MGLRGKQFLGAAGPTAPCHWVFRPFPPFSLQCGCREVQLCAGWWARVRHDLLGRRQALGAARAPRGSGSAPPAEDGVCRRRRAARQGNLLSPPETVPKGNGPERGIRRACGACIARRPGLRPGLPPSLRPRTPASMWPPAPESCGGHQGIRPAYSLGQRCRFEVRSGCHISYSFAA